jgi:3-hydroxyisobutyrate dehydrogenase
MKIAFLGTGRMGRELARHLLDDGHELTVWNRTASAADSLVEHGARPAENPRAAVDGADTVLTALFGPDAVREVVIDPPLPITAGGVWIDITTVSPADATGYARWAAERGVHYAHSPVVGSLAPARARALGVLLGGDAEAVARARPIVSTWAAPDGLRVYESAAKAATGKLVANLAVAIAMQGFVEALRLGHSGGLTTDEVITALDRTALSTIKDLKAASVRAGRFDDTQFSADLLSKDARLMTQTSEYPLPALTAAYAALESARQAGRGGEDFAVIAADDCDERV